MDVRTPSLQEFSELPEYLQAIIIAAGIVRIQDRSRESVEQCYGRLGLRLLDEYLAKG